MSGFDRCISAGRWCVILGRAVLDASAGFFAALTITADSEVGEFTEAHGATAAIVARSNKER